MGYIHIKNGANGQEHSIEEEATVQDMQREMNVPQEFTLVNPDGKRMPSGAKVKDYLKEGDTVMPHVQPRYGSSSSTFFDRIKSIYPDAEIIEGEFVLLPRIYLDTNKYNMTSTPLLISISDRHVVLGRPGLYVDRRLRLYGKRSRHLDERLTPSDMLRIGFVALCWYNIPRTNNLLMLVSNTIQYLDAMED